MVGGASSSKCCKSGGVPGCHVCKQQMQRTPPTLRLPPPCQLTPPPFTSAGPRPSLALAQKNKKASPICRRFRPHKCPKSRVALSAAFPDSSGIKNQASPSLAFLHRSQQDGAEEQARARSCSLAAWTPPLAGS